ncbi:MAG TPA: SIS domain-containing protein [Thermoplasmata archaeon]|jgi:3-hexulose-6-phosphate synthase/6-phospho-3-hexuloisomerase|nr:SIS domain-containing protein [Thermoplasmata archaeon]
MNNQDTFRESLDYIHRKTRDILQLVSKKEIDRIIHAFFKANRIFVYGAGRSGLVSKAFAIRLVHLGFQTFVIGETIGAPVKKGDLVCIVSGSGETIPAVMTAEIAKTLGAKLMVVTGKKNSRITKFADIAIILSADCTEKERKQFAPLGTLFEASSWILLDGIIAELMKNKKETEESMRSRHATLELP